VNVGGKYRVLVVDDEAAVLLTYRLILEQQGYEVMACGTSVEAITAIEQQLFDVVLCDYSLEEQHTGFEVISAARMRDPGVPAALLTGYATKDTADEAASRGIAVMFKPIEIDEFLETTSNMVRRNNESKQEDGEKGESGPQDKQGGAGDSGARHSSSTGDRKN